MTTHQTEHNAEARVPLEPLIRRVRPGGGWKRLSGPVWEHKTGIRVHIGGLVGFPDGRRIFTHGFNDDAALAIRQCGGNRKRGLMVFALRSA